MRVRRSGTSTAASGLAADQCSPSGSGHSCAPSNDDGRKIGMLLDVANDTGVRSGRLTDLRATTSSPRTPVYVTVESVVTRRRTRPEKRTNSPAWQPSCSPASAALPIRLDGRVRSGHHGWPTTYGWLGHRCANRTYVDTCDPAR